MPQWSSPVAVLPNLFVVLSPLLALDVMCCLARDGDDDAHDDDTACLMCCQTFEPCIGSVRTLVGSTCGVFLERDLGASASLPRWGQCLGARTLTIGLSYPAICIVRERATCDQKDPSMTLPFEGKYW